MVIQSSLQFSTESEPIDAILVASPVDAGNTPKAGRQQAQDDLFVEPVARAVQTSWHDFSRWFSGNGHSAGTYEKNRRRLDRWHPLICECRMVGAVVEFWSRVVMFRIT